MSDAFQDRLARLDARHQAAAPQMAPAGGKAAPKSGNGQMMLAMGALLVVPAVIAVGALFMMQPPQPEVVMTEVEINRAIVAEQPETQTITIRRGGTLN